MGLLVLVAAAAGFLFGLLVGSGNADSEAPQAASTTATVAATTEATTTTTTIPLVWPQVDWDRAPGDGAEFGGDAYQGMWAVAAGGPGWVGVGFEELGSERNAVVWTSSNGTTWSRVPHDDALFAGHRMYGVTAGGPGLVAVGWEWDAADRHAVAWTSPDGLSWTRVPAGDVVAGWQHMYAVTSGGPGLVAVGDVDGYAAVWTSIDGSAWARVAGDDSFADAVMWGVAAGPSGLVAVGERYGPDGLDSDAAVWTSPDGSTWALTDVGGFGGAGRQAAYGVTPYANGFVAVGADWSDGDAAGAVWWSPDGDAWFRVTPATDAFTGAVIHGVAAVGPGLTAVGWEGADAGAAAAVWVSADTVEWRRVAGGGATSGLRMYAVAAAPGEAVAVGHVNEHGIDAAAWRTVVGEGTTVPAEAAIPAGGDSAFDILMLGACDPRSDPDYCYSDYSVHRAFDTVAAGLGADVDYGIPAAAEDLTGYDVVVADFCGIPPGTGLVPLLGAYLDGGGGVLALGDSFCTWMGTPSAETATLLTGDHGVVISALADPVYSEVTTDVTEHPATASVASVFLSARDVLEVAPPAETVVEASFGPWVAVAEAGGRLAVVPDTGFFWDVREWYPEAADTDTMVLWAGLLAWLAGA